VYDYSNGRHDGKVYGAEFVPGYDGNAIRFDGNSSCRVLSNVVDLLSDFSIVFWVKVDEGFNRLAWCLSFAEDESIVEVGIDVKSGRWFSLALVRYGAVFSFYVDCLLTDTVTNANTLEAAFINQDSNYQYGVGILDDMKFYGTALRLDELKSALAVKNKKQVYLVDGIDIKEAFGVCVSDSEGVMNRPALKVMHSFSWDNYHGDAVDLARKFYQPRVINLSCFIKASSKNDFIMRLSAFEQLFDKPGTQRLVIDVHPTKPLIYEVYCKDEISVSKQWDDRMMIGTFNLKLIEPEPVKRVLRFVRVSVMTKDDAVSKGDVCIIEFGSQKLVNVYWGDGSADYDVSGSDVHVEHCYARNGVYFPVVTGCIDEITDFKTNAIVVWNKI
jgi:hypothetical protein